eukprot:Awhi_evm1s1070
MNKSVSFGISRGYRVISKQQRATSLCILKNHKSAVVVGSYVDIAPSHQGEPSVESTSHSSSSPPTKDLPKLDFDNVRTAFNHCSFSELIRSNLVFRTCKIQPLVKHSRSLVSASYAVLGQNITNFFLKKTFFGHFCGGEGDKELQVEIARLKKANVGAILDYAAEADVEEEHVVPGGGNVMQDHISARFYRYEDEAHCDENAKITLKAIASAAEQGPGGFAAVKLTSLTKPEFLEHVSSVLVETKKLFSAMASPDLTGKKSDEDRFVTFENFKSGIESSGLNLDNICVEKLFKMVDKNGDGQIDYYEWTSHVDPITLSMGSLSTFRRTASLNQESIQRMENMVGRLESLAEAANEKGVHLLIDAEQTYMQPAIDHMVVNLQRKYNKKSAVIYNTFQCYLKDSSSRARLDLARAKNENWIFACKLVRGAYMIQERARSKVYGYRDPIHETIEDTHDNYNSLAMLLLSKNHRCQFMVASHNPESAMLVANAMDEMNIPRVGGGVSFGQLLGMCDRITYNLSLAGYESFKYVPYGPVKEVLPYLIRRAEENGGLIGGAADLEISVVNEEIRRRVLLQA